MKSLSLCAAILLAPAVLVAAGERPASGTVRCRAFAIGKAPTEALYVKTGGHYEQLSVSTDNIGKSFRTAVNDGIVFYRKTTESELKQNDGKKEPYSVFATCKPSGEGRQLVFFMPGRGNDWNLIAKSDAEGSFPPGTRLVFNLSEHAVAFNFGGTKLAVKPHQSGLLLPPAKSEQGVAPVQIARQNASGDWILISNTAWLHQADARKIILIYPHGSDKISITMIQDNVEAKDKEEIKPPARK